MNIIDEFIAQSFLTLIILLGLSVLMYVNRKAEIEGGIKIVILMILVFGLSCCEYLETWCDVYDKDYHILFFKTTLFYWLYPMIAMLQLFLTAPVKHRLLLMIPQFVNMIVTAIDIKGTGLVYNFSSDHSFIGGPLRTMPMLIAWFYIILIFIYSLSFIRHGSKLKGLILIYLVIITLFASWLEIENISCGHIDEIGAFDLLIYYCYLAAVHQSNVSAALHSRELELQQSKVALLMSQIKPHFINNSLIAIQELCYEDPDKAAELINHFSRYLRHNIEASDNEKPVDFEWEIDAIKEYIELEYADDSKLFNISYDIRFADFKLPALSIEPLVENAVKHGIDRYSEDSEVVVASYDDTDNIYIEIRDNGKGFDMNPETLGKGGIGLKNSASRLKLMCNGDLSINHKEGWTVVLVKIPKCSRSDDDEHDNS